MVLGLFAGIAGTAVKGLFEFGRFLLKYGVFILLIVVIPFLFIWSLNTLMGTNLPYDFATWMAAVFFIGIPIVAIVVLTRRLL